MKKLIVTLLLALMVLTGCQRSGSEEPLMYQSRMKYAGDEIYIDTETGVCYWKTGQHVIILVDHTGKPYIANGWRDWGSDDEDY